MYYVPQVVVNEKTGEPVWYLGMHFNRKKNQHSAKILLPNGSCSHTEFGNIVPVWEKGKIAPGEPPGGFCSFFSCITKIPKRAKTEMLAELKDFKEKLKNGNV